MSDEKLILKANFIIDNAKQRHIALIDELLGEIDDAEDDIKIAMLMSIGVQCIFNGSVMVRNKGGTLDDTVQGAVGAAVQAVEMAWSGDGQRVKLNPIISEVEKCEEN